MKNELDITSIPKLYKEISTILRTARANAEFGKGFDESNLRYMRLFYQTFKNCDTLRHELTSIISIPNFKLRN